MNIRDNHRDFFLLVYPIIKLIVRNTSSVSWHIIRAGFVLVDTPTWKAFGEVTLQGKRLGRAELQRNTGWKRSSEGIPSFPSQSTASVISALWMLIQNNAIPCFILP